MKERRLIPTRSVKFNPIFQLGPCFAISAIAKKVARVLRGGVAKSAINKRSSEVNVKRHLEMRNSLGEKWQI
jgi:hypothetical protein